MRNAILLIGLIGVSSVACSSGDDSSLSSTPGSGSTGSGSTGTGGGIHLGATTGSGATPGVVPGGTKGPNGGLLVPVIIRDFPTTFPDMEFKTHEPAMSDPAKSYAADPGMVAVDISAEMKPVYAGPATGTVSTTGPANFAMWFNTVKDVNFEVPYALELMPQPADVNGVVNYVYDNQIFFPLDAVPTPWGIDAGKTHNFHFTLELHAMFTYKAGQVFTFIGDDDVWVFVNGKREVDLGGIHLPLTGKIEMDKLGLVPGKDYRMDFFFCERHYDQSHFRVETSISEFKPVPLK